jgi:hypothetical protein
MACSTNTAHTWGSVASKGIDAVKAVRMFSCVQPYKQHKQVSLLLARALAVCSVQCATFVVLIIASMLLDVMLSIELLWL